MRVKGGKVPKRRRQKITKLTEGYQGRNRNAHRVARHALERAWVYQYRDRKNFKREIRQLWITRITAAARARGLSYSRLLGALKAKDILINRKMLADLAATDPKSFDAVVRASGLNF